MDFTAIAAGLETDFYTTSFGMRADYTPASLLELDAMIDEVWGTTGLLAEDPNAKLNEGQWAAVLQYGAYAGEVIRRTCGGVWREEKPVQMSTVWFANNIHVLPINKAGKRFFNGREDGLFALFELASRSAPPQMDLAPGYLAHAESFASSRCPQPARDAVVQQLRTLAHPAARGPGTRLGACPKCHRAATPGRIACMYCGGALVVPKTCPQCRRNNAVHARSCMYCKTPL